MSLIGFQHTYAAGTFSNGELPNVMAGISYCLDQISTPFAATANGVQQRYWGPAGQCSDNDFINGGDDGSYWGAYYSYGSIAFLALRGFDIATTGGVFQGFDPENYGHPRSYYSFGSMEDAGALQVRFALDTVEGTWFFYAHDLDNDIMRTFISGVRSRRYPADGTQDNICRFGLFIPTDDMYRRFMLIPRYGVQGATALDHFEQGKIDIASPLGNGPVRGATQSGLGKIVAPLYPMSGYMSSYNMTAAAALMGELTSVMSASDAYLHEEQVAPGWVAYGSTDLGRLAYRSPNVADFVELYTILHK